MCFVETECLWDQVGHKSLTTKKQERIETKENDKKLELRRKLEDRKIDKQRT